MMNKYDIPVDIKHVCDVLDYNATAIGYDSWLSIGTDLWRHIIAEEDTKTLRKGQKILDLGSGSGSSTIQFATRGYETIGIELNPELADISQQLISRHKYIFKETKTQPPKIIQGSYFPQEYINRRTQNISEDTQTAEKNDLVKKIEAAHTKALNKGKLHLVGSADVYKKHRINLQEIDVFYAYKWSNQMPSVIDFFKEYSKKGALLMLFGPDSDQVAEEMKLVPVDGSRCFKRK